MAKPSDPDIPDWKNITLPNAWVDELAFRNPLHWLKLIAAILGKRHKVKLPDNCSNAEMIPKYAQQEFHHLPNGNYSNKLATGYIKGFDIAMLGKMLKARQKIGQALSNCNSVLDIGCGGGKTAQTIYDNGIKDVWGIDISPYLLKAAAIRHPNIQYIQAPAEHLPFPDERFDGVAICYVLHEIPPKYIAKILDEIHRVLKPRGKLVVIEPSPKQFFSSYCALFKTYGWQGCYFRLLSQKTYEPFIQSWHKTNISQLFNTKGFDIQEEVIGVPNRFFSLQKR